MNAIEIKYSDCFRTAQRFSQHIHTFWIGLYVKGMKFSRLWFPDGSIAENYFKDPGPYLFLRWAGMKTTCEYSSGRENWVTLFSCEGLEVGDGGRKLFLNWNSQRFELPLNTPLTASMLPVYRNRFREMSEKHSSGLPKNIFHSELILLNLLETMINSNEILKTASPAEKLKKLIDDDKNFKYNISELSEICGFSKDYLRNLFQQAYHISPKEYQKNKRLNAIIELITLTDTPLKEIAGNSGLKNVTHLNSLIKQKYGLSPRQLRNLQIT
jgi:AraC-like DNA-binding protein